MSRLLPSLRETNRYLAFAVEASQPAAFRQVSEAIWQGVIGFLGTRGTAEAGLWISAELWNQRTQQGILKITHTQADHCKAALALLNTIAGKAASVRSLGMSGTLVQAQGYLSG